MKIGLVLSGGGSKGAAHIGVLKALLEEKIEIEAIAGTSSGSIIASLYAMGYSVKQMQEIFSSYCSSMTDIDKLLPLKVIGCLFGNRLCIQGFCKGRALEKTVLKCATEKKVSDISDLKFSLVIPTVDVTTGEIVYFSNVKLKKEEKITKKNLYDDHPSIYHSGDIAAIVRASCSLPAVFPPKKIHGKLLVDGGIRMNTPVSILKDMGLKKIIAVTFDGNKNRVSECNNILSITMQSFDIMCHQINKNELDSADVLIRPDVSDVSLLGCDKIIQCIESGYQETKKQIKKMKL